MTVNAIDAKRDRDKIVYTDRFGWPSLCRMRRDRGRRRDRGQRKTFGRRLGYRKTGSGDMGDMAPD